jgi:hypothetical protein
MPPKKRSTVTPIKDPTLFEMGKLEEAGHLGIVAARVFQKTKVSVRRQLIKQRRLS